MGINAVYFLSVRFVDVGFKQECPPMVFFVLSMLLGSFLLQVAAAGYVLKLYATRMFAA